LVSAEVKLTDADYTRLFDQWRTAYGKVYDTPAAQEAAKAQFKITLAQTATANIARRADPQPVEEVEGEETNAKRINENVFRLIERELIEEPNEFADIDDAKFYEEYTGATPEPIVEAAVEGGLSPEAAGGVGAAAAAVAAAGAAGAGVVVYKRRKANKQPKQEETKETPAARPKGAGANVFQFDASNPASITGRSAPAAQWE